VQRVERTTRSLAIVAVGVAFWHVALLPVRKRPPTVNLSQMDIEPHAVQIGDFDLYDVLERKCGGGFSH
jgi:hypothetical protein